MAVRLSLFLLIRVLLKILDRDGDRQTRGKVQQALNYCQKKNKEGDPAFRSLAMSIQKLVRTVVGEKRWRQAEMACVVVMSKKQAHVKPQTLLKQRSKSKLGGPEKRQSAAVMAAPTQTAARSASTPAQRPLASLALTEQSSLKPASPDAMPQRSFKSSPQPASAGYIPSRAPETPPQPTSAGTMPPRVPKTSPQLASIGTLPLQVPNTLLRPTYTGTMPPRAPINTPATQTPASQLLRSQSASSVVASDGMELSSQKRQQPQQPARHVRIKSTPTVVGFFGALPSQQERGPGGAAPSTFASVVASVPRIPVATQHVRGTSRSKMPLGSTLALSHKATKGRRPHPNRSPPMPAALAATLAAAMGRGHPPARSPVAAVAAASVSTAALPSKPATLANSTRLPTMQESPPSLKDNKASAASRPDGS